MDFEGFRARHSNLDPLTIRLNPLAIRNPQPVLPRATRPPRAAAASFPKAANATRLRIVARKASHDSEAMLLHAEIRCLQSLLSKSCKNLHKCMKIQQL